MEKTLQSKILYQGKVFQHRQDQVLTHSGEKAIRDVIVHPGAVAIVPVVNDKEIILIKQFRKALDKEIYEIPAGTLEPGEPPERCAQRELEEECGYQAKKWEKSLSFYTAPGFCTELIHLFFARDLTQTVQNLEPDEQIEPISANWNEIQKWIAEKKIQDAKTMVGISVWRGCLGKI